MQPDTHWDGNKAVLFTVGVIISDLGNATEPESPRRCGGLQVFLNKAPIADAIQCFVKCMAEGELIASCDAD